MARVQMYVGNSCCMVADFENEKKGKTLSSYQAFISGRHHVLLSMRKDHSCSQGVARCRAAGGQYLKLSFACLCRQYLCFPSSSQVILQLQLTHITELESKMSGLNPTPIKEKWFINQFTVQEEVKLFINLAFSSILTQTGRNGCCQIPFDGSLDGQAMFSIL